MLWKIRFRRNFVDEFNSHRPSCCPCLLMHRDGAEHVSLHRYSSTSLGALPKPDSVHQNRHVESLKVECSAQIASTGFSLCILSLAS